MTTTLAILSALFLYFLCGAGPALLLLPRNIGPQRLVAIPVVGLCGGILFTLFLARFGLTGHTIGVAALVFFSLLALAAVLKAPPSRAELKSALPVAILCLAGGAVVAWPLIYEGYGDYWGYANPDHALYIPIFEYLHTHPFGVPQADFLGTFRSLGLDAALKIGYDNSVILGISYFFSMLSMTTGIPVSLLFGVVTASVAVLVPASVFLLCNLALGLSRSACLVITGLSACSSLVAYTFYLQSLGTMTVMVILPAGIAFTVSYLNRPRWQVLLLLAMLVVGMYYDYFPGFAILGLAMAGISASGVLTRKYALRPVFILGGTVLAGLAAVSHGQALVILHRLLAESFSSRLATKEEELFVSFALALTERGLPFFWGLRVPYLPVPPTLLGSSDLTFAALFGLSACMFAVLGFCAWRRFSGICTEYFWAVGPTLTLMSLYVVTGNGYGAFKLIAWIHPLMLPGLAAGCFGILLLLRRTRFRALSVLPSFLLLAWAVLNVTYAVELGRNSLGISITGEGSLNNAPRLRFRAFRELQNVADAWGGQGIVIAVPDAVAQRWIMPFFRRSQSEFFPRVDLNVTDSVTRAVRAHPRGEFVLHWTDDSQELFGGPLDSAVWRNESFALTPLKSCRDILFFGTGWYRKELVPGSRSRWRHSFRWLRKRGELMVLSPSGRPKRLILKLVAGYGDPAPDRHLDLFLNGVKFDEIQFSGQTRTLSRPFAPTPPWSQIELAVRETAKPLPRKHALWNRWVPADARRLNVAIAEVALVDAQETDDGVQSAVSFNSPEDMNRAFLDGIYEDGWVGAAASIRLRVPAEPEAIKIAGTVPGVRVFSFPYRLDLYLDGKAAGQYYVSQAGAFRIRIPAGNLKIPLRPGWPVTLTIRPSGTFDGYSLGTSQDRRSLSILLSEVALTGGQGNLRRSAMGLTN